MSLPPSMLAQAIQLIRRGDYPQAIGLLQNTVAAQPSHFESRLQLAKAYLDWVNIRVQMPLTDIRPDMMSEDVAHFLKLAESQLIELVRMRPSSPHAQGLLAVVHLICKRPTEAMACLKKALAKDPLNQDLLYNLGFSLMELKRFAEAAKQFARLTALLPGHGMGWHMLGEATRQGGDPEAALVAYRQAIKLLPDLPQPYGGMALALIMLGRHAEGLAYQKQILVLLPSTDMSASALFNLHYIPGLAATEVASWHRAFGERFETPLKSAWQPHTNATDPERPLRVGFVSGDFRRHSVGYFMTDLLPGLKACGLELYAYANQWENDDLTDRIKPQFAAWRECKSMNDDALAAQIRADGIDVLVDLSGHTNDDRLLAFARKPAPVQVTYLGYPDTTGLSAIDYILGDPRMFPPGEETLYVEKPWCL
ncbi:MAG: tetratricopeptide repeat protein, partial [Thiobacillus sp.]